MAAILVLDDDENMLDLFTEALTDAGHQVTTAKSTEDAMAVAEEDTFDLLLTDIFMPSQGGLEVIRLVRKRSPELPVIAMSGFDLREGVDILEMARRQGADRTFQKPVVIEELLSAVQDLLEA